MLLQNLSLKNPKVEELQVQGIQAQDPPHPKLRSQTCANHLPKSNLIKMAQRRSVTTKVWVAVSQSFTSNT